MRRRRWLFDRGPSATAIRKVQEWNGNEPILWACKGAYAPFSVTTTDRDAGGAGTSRDQRVQGELPGRSDSPARGRLLGHGGRSASVDDKGDGAPVARSVPGLGLGGLRDLPRSGRPSQVPLELNSCSSSWRTCIPTRSELGFEIRGPAKPLREALLPWRSSRTRKVGHRRPSRATPPRNLKLVDQRSKR
jgi:hypothetical protein